MMTSKGWLSGQVLIVRVCQVALFKAAEGLTKFGRCTRICRECLVVTASSRQGRSATTTPGERPGGGKQQEKLIGPATLGPGPAERLGSSYNKYNAIMQ